MKNTIKIFSLAVLGAILLSGCTKTAENDAAACAKKRIIAKSVKLVVKRV